MCVLKTSFQWLLNGVKQLDLFWLCIHGLKLMSFLIFGRTLGWGAYGPKNIFFSVLLTLNKGQPMSEYWEYGVRRWSKSCRNNTNEISKANFPSSKGGSGCLKKCMPYIFNPNSKLNKVKFRSISLYMGCTRASIFNFHPLLRFRTLCAWLSGWTRIWRSVF